MNAAILLSAVLSASGLEPIARPDAPEPVEGECDEAIAIDRGERIPGELVYDTGVARCSAVVLPLSEMQDLLVSEEWAQALSSRYTVDTAHLEWQLDWYKSQLSLANAPVPFWQRPDVRFVVGVTTGLGMTLGGAYAVSLVSQ